jgi:glycosyltransferase involved in cell wall biosynthesis
MRIGLVAPPWLTVPPTGYGGTELVIDLLARGLAARGHEVRLFTVGTSTCPVPRAHVFAEPQVPMGNTLSETAQALSAYQALADVDLVHDHTTVGPLAAAAAGVSAEGLARGLSCPVVVTNHGPFTLAARLVFEELARHSAVVAVSHDQARAAGPVPISAVIHHGIDTAAYQPGPGSGGYALFVGRMSPDKGAHRAIRIARSAGLPIVVATKVQDREERQFFVEQVEPLLGADVELLDDVAIDRKVALYQGAVALLNPITWPEPFGLVMIEALASGTPVLAYPSGASPEIVDPGRTGFLCSDEDDMAMRLGEVGQISRFACREAAEERFSMERMAADHERLYERLLEGAGARDCLTQLSHPGWG